MTVFDLYNQTVRALAPTDRLRLAALILNDMVPATVDDDTRWSDEDLRDFGAATWSRADVPATEENRGEAG